MKKFCLILLLVLVCTGCSRKSAQPVQVVQKITVSIANRRDIPVRVYSDSHKMQRLLDYLRRLDRRDTRDQSAEAGDGITFLITLHKSDGSITVYRQKAWRYLHTTAKGWQKLEPRQAQHLALLLAALPGD